MSANYKGIIKTTGFVGLIQVVKMLFGFIQNKVLAVLVGPAGFGIWGLFNSFVQLVASFSTLGIDQAGVRQIARIDEQDLKGRAQVIWIFKTAVFILSVFSILIVLLFSRDISYYLFGNEDYHIGVMIVSLAILFTNDNQGNYAILNGYQDLKKLAKSQIIGTIIGAIVATVIVYFLEDRGIPLFILVTCLITVIFSRVYVRYLGVQRILPKIDIIINELKELFRIGIGIAYSALIVALMTYLIQVFVRKEFGLETLGIYNASFTISNLYIGIILNAMGVDLMPRLSKVINNNDLVNSLVNSQMELGLLVVSIGLCGVLLYSDIIIQILYSHSFSNGSSIIRWQVLGVYFRVLSFPLGYILILRKETLKYVFVQTLMWGGNYLFLLVLSKYYGVSALGINYLIAYMIYIIVLFTLNKNCVTISGLLVKIFIVSFGFIAVSWLVGNICTLTYRVLLGIPLLILNLLWVNMILKREMNIDVKEFISKKIGKR